MTSFAPLNESEELSRLREDNETLRDDLLDLLQEPPGQATDADIRTRYNDLCQSIDFWVENVMSDSHLDGEKARMGHKERTLLRDAQFGSNACARMSDHTLQSLILSLAIYDRVFNLIFSRAYPIGIVEPQTTVLNQVSAGMKNAGFRDGRIVRTRWVSQAVRSLTASSEYESRYEAQLKTIIRNAKDYMIPKSGSADRKRHEKSLLGLNTQVFNKHVDIFEDEIFRPAARLHHSIRSSASQYKWERPKVSRTMDGGDLLARKWRFRDVINWQPRTDLTRNETYEPLGTVFYGITKHAGNPGDYTPVAPPLILLAPVPMQEAFNDAAERTPLSSAAQSVVSDSPIRDGGRQREHREQRERRSGQSSPTTEPGHEDVRVEEDSLGTIAQIFRKFVPSRSPPKGRSAQEATYNPVYGSTGSTIRGEQGRGAGNSREQRHPNDLQSVQRYRHSPDGVRLVPPQQVTTLPRD